MASSVSLGPAWLMDGPLFNAQILRQSDVSARAYNAGSGGAVITRGGVLQGATRMKVSAGSGMQVTVDGGSAVVPSSVSAVQGAYQISSMALVTLDVATSDPTNPRIDLVTVTCTDNGDATSSAYLQVITGTPAAVPSPPTAPANSLILAQVLVPALSSSVTAGNITDKRPITVAPGGILPLNNTTSPPAGQTGQYAYDAANDRLFHLSGTGALQAKVLPFAPQSDGPNNASYTGGSAINVCSVSVTTDGSTDLEIHVSWEGYSVFNSASNAVFQIKISGTVVRQCRVQNSATDGSVHGGGGFTHVTRSGTDRPAAGAHTIAATYTDTQGSGLHPSGPTAVELYVRPVPL